MEPKTGPLKIVDLLAYQEYKLALLYNEFAHQFPEAAELWENMKVDELEHQKLVRGLNQYVEAGKLYFNAMILKTSKLENHIESLEKLIERAKDEGEFSLQEAVELAINLEQSMLDQNFFTFYSGDSEILNKTLDLLTRDTQEHYNMLLEEAEKLGFVK
jgi:rubrerythrin